MRVVTRDGGTRREENATVKTRTGIRTFWSSGRLEPQRVRATEAIPIAALLVLCVAMTVAAGRSCVPPAPQHTRCTTPRDTSGPFSQRTFTTPRGKARHETCDAITRVELLDSQQLCVGTRAENLHWHPVVGTPQDVAI